MEIEQEICCNGGQARRRDTCQGRNSQDHRNSGGRQRQEGDRDGCCGKTGDEISA